jgi:hypothetical protein
VVALAGGASIRRAAARARVSERTAYRRLDDPEFRRRVSAVRAEAIEQATGRLAIASTAAARTLRKLLRSKDERVQLAAGRWILRLGIAMKNEVEIQKQIDALNAAVFGGAK